MLCKVIILSCLGNEDKKKICMYSVQTQILRLFLMWACLNWQMQNLQIQRDNCLQIELHTSPEEVEIQLVGQMLCYFSSFQQGPWHRLCPR